MEGLVDVLVVMLASLTNASLQLGTGTLLLLYNESLGRKIHKKTRSVTRGFILGSFLFSVLLISTTMLLILLINSHPLVENGLILLSSLALAMAILVIGLYWRRGKNTMLWIPDFVAKYFRKRAGKVDTPIEGAALGMTTVLSELPFSAVLILIAANSLLNLPQATIILALVGYALVTVIPLIIMKLLIRNGTTLAEIQRWRVKNKTFLRIFAGICYITLAVFIIAFKLLEKM